MLLRTITVLSLLCLLSQSAEAQPGMSPPGQAPIRYSYEPAPAYVQQPLVPQTRTIHYGWQVFAADALSWALLSASIDSGNDNALASIGVGGIFLGGPLVHLSQGNGKGAVYSLVARAGLPYVGALALSASCSDSGDFSCLGNVLLGAMLGYGTALSLDYWVWSKKTESIAPPSGWASLRPSLQISDTGAKAGLALTF